MLSNIVDNHMEIGARLGEIAPSGYTIALNLHHVTAEFFYSTYPNAWLKAYKARRYLVIDPVNVWISLNNGATRWSDLQVVAPTPLVARLFSESAKHGLIFGAVSSLRSHGGTGAKSYLTAARADREVTDTELAELEVILEHLASAIDGRFNLSQVERDALRLLSEGYSYEETADLLTVSRETVKKRAERARKQLGAKNTVHAVTIASKRGLI